MIDVRIFDKEFMHAQSYSGSNVPKHFRWKRDGPCTATNFFTNQCLGDFEQCVFDKRIAWMTEPPSMNPESYRKIVELEHEFDYVLTYDKRLLDRGQQYLFYPIGGSWIPEDVDLSPPKTKLLSMISSNKRGCVGYELRHDIVEALHPHMEIFGQIVSKPIRCKTEGLLPFKFSIVVENDQLDDYFTEKLIDCLACGTIPFYWGTPSIGRFDADGIIPFNNVDDLTIKLALYCDDTFYKENQNAVLHNIEAAKQYRVPENWIYEHYPFLFT